MEKLLLRTKVGEGGQQHDQQIYLTDETIVN